MTFATGLALILCLASSVVFYLGCPNQQWLDRRPLSFYPALAISLMGFVIGWVSLSQVMTAASSTYLVITLLMLFLGLIPFLGRLELPKKVQRSTKSIFQLEKGEAGANYKPQWWIKIITVLVLGFPLAVNVSGLVGYWGAGDVTHDTKSQLVMWLVTPLWLTPMALAFFTISAWRVLIGYISLNLIFFLLIKLAQSGV